MTVFLLGGAPEALLKLTRVKCIGPGYTIEGNQCLAPELPPE
jgi:hypothetical protein